MISSTSAAFNGWQRNIDPSRPWGYGPGIVHPRWPGGLPLGEDSDESVLSPSERRAVVEAMLAAAGRPPGAGTNPILRLINAAGTPATVTDLSSLNWQTAVNSDVEVQAASGPTTAVRERIADIADPQKRSQQLSRLDQEIYSLALAVYDMERAERGIGSWTPDDTDPTSTVGDEGTDSSLPGNFGKMKPDWWKKKDIVNRVLDAAVDPEDPASREASRLINVMRMQAATNWVVGHLARRGQEGSIDYIMDKTTDPVTGRSEWVDRTLQQMRDTYYDASVALPPQQTVDQAGLAALGLNSDPLPFLPQGRSRLDPSTVGQGTVLKPGESVKPKPGADDIPLGMEIDSKGRLVWTSTGQEVGDYSLLAMISQDVQERIDIGRAGTKSLKLENGVLVPRKGGQTWNGYPVVKGSTFSVPDESYFNAWSANDVRNIPLQGTFKGQEDGQGKYAGWAQNPEEVAKWQQFFVDSGLYMDMNKEEKRLLSPVPGAWGPAEAEAFSTLLTWANERQLFNSSLDEIKALYLSSKSMTGGTGTDGTDGPTYPRTVTNTSVSLSNLQAARAVLRGTLANMIGRRATPAEEKAFLRALNAEERANPQVTTTTYNSADDISTYTTGGQVDGMSVLEDWITGDEVLDQRYDNYQRLRFFLSMQDMIFGSGRPTSAGMGSPW